MTCIIDDGYDLIRGSWKKSTCDLFMVATDIGCSMTSALCYIPIQMTN